MQKIASKNCLGCWYTFPCRDSDKPKVPHRCPLCSPAPHGLRGHRRPLGFPAAASVSQRCRDGLICPEPANRHPTLCRTFLKQQFSLLQIYICGFFFSHKQHLTHAISKYKTQHTQMFHRRREGPLFPPGEQHSNNKRRAGPYLAEGRRRAHTRHTLHGGGTQIFAAKLERKSPYRELQLSVSLLLEGHIHGRILWPGQSPPWLNQTYQQPEPLLSLYGFYLS